MKVAIESIHFTADQKLLDYIEKKVNKLGQFFDKIIDVDVKLRLENTGQIKDKIFDIRINVPGETLFISESNKNFEAAADAAVAVMKRQIIKYKEGLRSY
ncbi:MAG: ribosome-associated translation inhibitor RaiA [Saprospirales bacterium]|jgi:putative sigma-54 modulation protein|nr:MAG: ribosome-associated translation inhibitor RaiA [Saprospirales bacterium]